MLTTLTGTTSSTRATPIIIHPSLTNRGVDRCMVVVVPATRSSAVPKTSVEDTPIVIAAIRRSVAEVEKLYPGVIKRYVFWLQKLHDHFTEIDHDAYLSMRGLAYVVACIHIFMHAFIIRSFVIFDGSYLILRSFLFILYRIQNQ